MWHLWSCTVCSKNQQCAPSSAAFIHSPSHQCIQCGISVVAEYDYNEFSTFAILFRKSSIWVIFIHSTFWHKWPDLAFTQGCRNHYNWVNMHPLLLEIFLKMYLTLHGIVMRGWWDLKCAVFVHTWLLVLCVSGVCPQCDV